MIREVFKGHGLVSIYTPHLITAKETEEGSGAVGVVLVM